MKTIYLNLEDDVARIVAKVKALKGEDAVLVIPKDAYVLADSINLRLLKKQTDILGSKVSILTMDETGQIYAREAGFTLKNLPKISRSKTFSDIRPQSGSKSVMTFGKARYEVNPSPVSDMQDEFIAPAVRPAAKPKKVVRKVAAKSAERVASRSAQPVAKSSMVGAGIAAGKILEHRGAKVAAARQSPLENNDWLTPTTGGLRTKADNMFMPPSSKSSKAPRRRSYKKFSLAFVALALIAVVALVVMVLPSANVTVYARSQTVARDLDLTIDTNLETVDASRLTLPATKVDETKAPSNSFTTNGKKEVGSKAQGRVAIYNLTGSAMNLRTSTTVLTVGTKSYYFVSDQNGIVALENPSKDSNATTADIIAADGGEDFNLPAGTRVEITNQAFGSQPQRLYAKTVTQVIGGSSRFVSVVSKEDLDRAQKELISKAVEEVNNGLSDGRKLVEGAYNVEVSNFTSDKPEGTESTTFVASANIKITGLAFNENDLRQMVRGRLTQTLGSDKALQEADLDQVVYKIKNLDLAAGLMQLSIHYESQAKAKIDQQDLVAQLAGKSKEQANDILLTNQNIERADITLAPSWQKSFPRLGTKIHIKIEE
ncbi:hypothetical protein IPM19_03065 [bacterium]|nr:MAG: hypothetical protein IPM19_03065 [bacterium]